MTTNLINKARSLLEEKGWVQRSYHNLDGYCLVGAGNEAAGLHASSQQSYAFTHIVKAAIKELHPAAAKEIELNWPLTKDDHRDFVITYNDFYAKTKEEIFEVLDRAEKIWERDHE